MLACDCHLILTKLPWTSITVKYNSSHHNTHPSECKKTDLQPTVCLFSCALKFIFALFFFLYESLLPPLWDIVLHFLFLSVCQWLRSCRARLYCRDLVSIIIVCAQLPCADSEKAEHEEIELATGCYRKSASLICFCLWPEIMTCSVPLCLS